MISYDLIKEIFDLDDPLTLEYFELCSVAYEGEGEKHHILPRSIWPEYEKAKWNIINLAYSDHYTVHEILPNICKSVENKRKMLSAWYLMLYTREGIMVDNMIYEELKSEKRRLTSGENSLLYGKKKSLQHIENISGHNHWMYGIDPECHPMFGKKHSEQSKILMSLAKAGTPLSVEHKYKISVSNSKERNGFYGKKHSEESKRLMSENNYMLGKYGELHPFFGKHHTSETKRIISKRHTGRKDTIETIMKRAEASSVYMYEQYGLHEELVRVWTSFELNKHAVFNNSHVTAVCLGKRRTHGGFIWKRVLK